MPMIRVEEIREKLKDPMLVILAGLLVFLTLGTGIHGCTQLSRDKKVICIDAAYGGSLNGYEGIVNESEVTAKTADQLVSLLEEDRNYTVVRTTSGSSVSDRLQQIAKLQPDLVISIHAEGSMDGKSGMRNCVQLKTNAHYESSVRLAQCISEAFESCTETFTGTMYYQPLEDGVFARKDVDLSDSAEFTWDTWSILSCNCPAVVSDLCHVSSQSDVDLWCNDKGYETAAKLYYEAVNTYYGNK
ncbi:MAG: N-acetylmuramoyl-L-alanine amidase [Bulleidia sp.]